MTKLCLYVPDYGVFADKDVHRRHIVVGERAEAEGIVSVNCRNLANADLLSQVHTPDYVEAFKTGEPWNLASTGGDWFPGFVEISLSVLGNYLGAIDAALQDGVAGVAAGGGHHAFPDHGGALCPINDVATGIHHLRQKGIRKVLVLDLDAHFGNSTAACIPNDPEVFLFDFHGHASNFTHPDTPHLFKNFHDEPDAQLYLRTLRKELPRVLDEFKPDFCIYGAGMDVFSGTPNPPLRLKIPDIEKRDAFVFEELSSRGIRTAYVHSGGYASHETVVKLHLITARAAHSALATFPASALPTKVTLTKAELNAMVDSGLVYEYRKSMEKIKLNDGRYIRLTDMYREETYLTLIQGDPDSCDNDQRIHDFANRSSEKLYGQWGKAGFHLLPFEVMRPPEWDWEPLGREIAPPSNEGKLGEVELLPATVSIATFVSDPTKDNPYERHHSILSVMWLQRSSLITFEDKLLDHLRKINWNELAENVSD